MEGSRRLFKVPGLGSLYLDNQGTQGFLYNPGNNFQSFSFRNPTTGQAWSGAVTTLGPQLSIGLIQGANQIGSPLSFPALPAKPRRCHRFNRRSTTSPRPSLLRIGQLPYQRENIPGRGP